MTTLREDAGWCTLVVPCYNEAGRLPVEQFSAFLAHDKSVSFLFVNDGSSDSTLAVLEELKARHPDCIEILNRQINAGKADAVRHGMLAAIGKGTSAYTGFWDADLATPLDAIPDLLNILFEQPRIDMVFGARVRLLGRAISRDPARHYLGRIFATAISSMLRLPIYDTQCGAKLFRITPDLRTILAKPFQSCWIFDVEILVRYLVLHEQDTHHAYNTIYEIPLQTWADIAGSKVRSSDFFKAFYELIQLRAQRPR